MLLATPALRYVGNFAKGLLRYFLIFHAASATDSVHVVIDRNLITGQNSISTLTAVQNLILATNAR